MHCWCADSQQIWLEIWLQPDFLERAGYRMCLSWDQPDQYLSTLLVMLSVCVLIVVDVLEPGPISEHISSDAWCCLSVDSGGCAFQRESSWTKVCRDPASSVPSTDRNSRLCATLLYNDCHQISSRSLFQHQFY